MCVQVYLSVYCPELSEGDNVAIFSHGNIRLGVDDAFVSTAYTASSFVSAGNSPSTGDKLLFGRINSPVTFRIKFYVNIGE